MGRYDIAPSENALGRLLLTESGQLAVAESPDSFQAFSPDVLFADVLLHV